MPTAWPEFLGELRRYPALSARRESACLRPLPARFREAMADPFARRVVGQAEF